MRKHVFDIDVAQIVGVNAAILLENIAHWIEHNRANEDKKSFHDGRYWTYNSMKAFSELFPYLKPNAVRTALKKLKEADLIIVGNYNKLAYDRTQWYALTEKAEALLGIHTSICKKSQMDSEENTNGFATNDEPIPDITSVVTSSVTSDVSKPKHERFAAASLEDKDTYAEIVDYLNAKAGTRYRASTASTRKHIKARLDEGFTVEDFKSVIDKKCSEWLGNSKMEQYLRPETLFGTKFEGYLNAKVNVNRQEKGANGVDLRPLEPGEDTSWFPMVSTSNI